MHRIAPSALLEEQIAELLSDVRSHEPERLTELGRLGARVIPDSHKGIRTRPLQALVIGSYVRGLSDRDIESLVEEAGPGPDQGHRRDVAGRRPRPLYGASAA